MSTPESHDRERCLDDVAATLPIPPQHCGCALCRLVIAAQNHARQHSTPPPRPPLAQRAPAPVSDIPIYH